MITTTLQYMPKSARKAFASVSIRKNLFTIKFKSNGTSSRNKCAIAHLFDDKHLMP